MEIVADREEPPVLWNQLAESMRSVPGVEKVALADWPLMSENLRGGYISVEGNRPFKDPAFFLDVSPGWINAMQIPLISGRDFQSGDSGPKVAIVNEAFVKQFFNGENALGKTFTTRLHGEELTRIKVVGLVHNARLAYLGGPMPPAAYFPFNSVDPKGAFRSRNSGSVVVRTSNPKPLLLAPIVRRAVVRAGPEFHVTKIRTQDEIDSMQTMQERLLATLALFFAGIALLLAGVGLYGVLDYSVFLRRREIGVRMAIGAQPAEIVWRLSADVFAMVLAGAVAGLALGVGSVRYIESLLYYVKATDLGVITIPPLAILIAAMLAGLPAMIHAVRIDPVNVLRAE